MRVIVVDDLLEKARAEGHKFEVFAKPIRLSELVRALRLPQRVCV